MTGWEWHFKNTCFCNPLLPAALAACPACSRKSTVPEQAWKVCCSCCHVYMCVAQACMPHNSTKLNSQQPAYAHRCSGTSCPRVVTQVACYLTGLPYAHDCGTLVLATCKLLLANHTLSKRVCAQGLSSATQLASTIPMQHGRNLDGCVLECALSRKEGVCSCIPGISSMPPQLMTTASEGGTCASTAVISPLCITRLWP